MIRQTLTSAEANAMKGMLARSLEFGTGQPQTGRMPVWCLTSCCVQLLLGA
jgi:hypothetical protein